MTLHNITFTVNFHEDEQEGGYLLQVARETAEHVDQNHGHSVDVLRWEVAPHISIEGVG